MQFIKEKKPYFHTLLAVVAFILIIPFFSFNSETIPTTKAENFKWTDIGLYEMLPEPAVNKGKIHYNSETALYITDLKLTEKQYKDYISACKEKGFSVEGETDSNSYNAYNQAGYVLSLSYNSEKMDIRLGSPIKMSEIVWPTSDMVKLLPVPKSSIGNISLEYADNFAVYVGNTPIVDYNAYVKACSDAGFNVDYRKSDKYYYASNKNGYILSVNYSGNNIMYISIDGENSTPIVEQPKDSEPAITYQNLNFYGIDFSFPSYFDMKTGDSTEAHMVFYPEEEDYYATLIFIVSDLNLSAKDFATEIPKFLKEIANETKEIAPDAEVLKSEKLIIAGMDGWIHTAASAEHTLCYSFVYNESLGKLIQAIVMFDEEDQSDFDYLGDFETMLKTAALSPENGAPAPSNSTTTDWRQFLKDYEKFVDSYIAVLKKYKANPTDLGILSDYMTMMTDATEWADKYANISDELNDTKEVAEFLKEWTRIYTKLLNAINEL